METENMKIIIICVIIFITTFVVTKEQPTKIIYKEVAKESTAVVEDNEYIYAGRHDKSYSEYNSLGLPKDRYWLTSSEWKGKHIRKMNINNTEKRLLLNRFKMWKENHKKTFVQEMLKAAVEECKVYKQIPPSLIVAQAILESNFGLSRLAIDGNNYFGHKYRGKDVKKFLVAHDDSPTDRFTKYRSTWFSLRAHTKGLLMKRYFRRIKGTPTLNKWLAALCGGMTTGESKKFVENGGTTYATSCYKGVCYVEKLNNLIKNYNLDIFDKR